MLNILSNLDQKKLTIKVFFYIHLSSIFDHSDHFGRCITFRNNTIIYCIALHAYSETKCV